MTGRCFWANDQWHWRSKIWMVVGKWVSQGDYFKDVRTQKGLLEGTMDVFLRPTHRRHAWEKTPNNIRNGNLHLFLHIFLKQHAIIQKMPLPPTKMLHLLPCAFSKLLFAIEIVAAMTLSYALALTMWSHNNAKDVCPFSVSITSTMSLV